MPAKVLVIAFDAMEATLVERWASEGKLPTFRRLGEEGTLFRLSNRVDTLPAAIWPEITTGRNGGTIGSYWNRSQLHTGEARLRMSQVGDVDLTAFWRLASDAGATVAVLDVPISEPTPGLNGVHLREWGEHHTGFGFGSDPPDFADKVLRRFGEYPGPNGDNCEVHESEEAYRELRTGLLAGIERREQLLRSVLDEREWDLFFTAYSEAHCVSHQFWRFFDESSPWYERVAPDDLRTAIPIVYRRLDSSLAYVLEGAGEDTTIFVLLSHGMGQSVGGPQVLPEVLVRLGYASGHGAASSVRSRLPSPVKRAIKTVIRGSLRRRLQSAAGSLPQPLESPLTRALALPNARCGGIRLNVKGRDPFGAIEPGARYDEACADLIEAIGELEHVDTGESAVDSIVRADSLFGELTHPNLPDLIVRFNQSRPIKGVRSRRIGIVRTPIEEHANQRSGDHTPHSHVWVRGPGVAEGLVLDDGDVLDLAPTVLEILGVPIPETLHGTSLPLTAARIA